MLIIIRFAFWTLATCITTLTYRSSVPRFACRSGLIDEVYFPCCPDLFDILEA